MTESAGRRIVVGVDGSAGAVAALRWALAEARLHGASLDVVHAWQPPTYYSSTGLGIVPVDLSEVAAGAKEVLEAAIDDALDGALADDLTIRPLVVEGPPANVLLGLAAGADLLVVGSRGLGGFSALMLGSVSHRCTHHAPCPVAVVPPPSEG